MSGGGVGCDVGVCVGVLVSVCGVGVCVGVLVCVWCGGVCVDGCGVFYVIGYFIDDI